MPGSIQWRVHFKVTVQKVETGGPGPDFIHDETIYSCTGTTFQQGPALAISEALDKAKSFFARLSVDPTQEES